MLKIVKTIYKYHKKMQNPPPIKLTSQQQKIFTILTKFRNDLHLKTILRVAGGWVRDKVLGKQSKDIDIVLDNMKGQQFVTLLKQHSLKEQSQISGFGVTKFNPELSKHLQTATAKINNHWIDFVNLRSEKYSEDSRIPTIVIGTPLQDAQRRDFTINSLFYNIDQQKLQDWTGKGILDIQHHILRTPIDPIITFKDDPLRILRCLRFKSRFNFQIDHKIYQTILLPQIQQCLLKKVSKQRIGIELAGLLKAQSFLSGLEDIKNYGLWNIVFQVPKQCSLSKNQHQLSKIPQLAFTSTKMFIQSLKNNGWITKNQLITIQQEKDEQKQKQKIKQKKKHKIQYQQHQLQFMIILSSLVYGYGRYQVKTGKSMTSLISFMVKDQLKYAVKYAKFALHFQQSIDKLSKIKSLDNLYQIIRWLRFACQKWQLSIHFLHIISYLTTKTPYQIDLFLLRQKILQNNISNCYLSQSPIDGHVLVKKGIKGSIISRILENAVIWKIANPGKSNEQFLVEFQENREFFMAENTYK